MNTDLAAHFYRLVAQFVPSDQWDALDEMPPKGRPQVKQFANSPEEGPHHSRGGGSSANDEVFPRGRASSDDDDDDSASEEVLSAHGSLRRSGCGVEVGSRPESGPLGSGSSAATQPRDAANVAQAQARANEDQAKEDLASIVAQARANKEQAQANEKQARDKVEQARDMEKQAQLALDEATKARSVATEALSRASHALSDAQTRLQEAEAKEQAEAMEREAHASPARQSSSRGKHPADAQSPPQLGPRMIAERLANLLPATDVPKRPEQIDEHSLLQWWIALVNALVTEYPSLNIRQLEAHETRTKVIEKLYWWATNLGVL